MEIWELLVREQVRHNIGTYTFSGDRGRLADLAACFALDGSMQIDGGEPVVGRQAIVDNLSSILPADPAPTFVRHHVSSICFTSVTPEVAEVSSYFFVISDNGPDHWGRYRDRLIPVDDRWLFEKRQIVVDGYGERSVFKSEVPRS